jgi:hypothetical protein
MGSGRREMLQAWGRKAKRTSPWGARPLDWVADYFLMPSFSMIVR